jgi:hypothetical protein
MKARIQKVRKNYGVELGVVAIVMTVVVAYAFFGSMMLGKF